MEAITSHPKTSNHNEPKGRVMAQPRTHSVTPGQITLYLSVQARVDTCDKDQSS